MQSKNILSSNNLPALFIRITVGVIFLSEGLQKFIFPDIIGPGRFLAMGFANPDFWAYLTAGFEVICGFLVLAGLMTRLASVPLLTIMVVAFIKTKWPILDDSGFWSFAHAYRTDFAMTLLLLYLIIAGGGGYAADRMLPGKSKK
jgi:uncharacterized membrane protein YphA (DoxX/SURF4 family)